MKRPMTSPASWGRCKSLCQRLRVRVPQWMITNNLITGVVVVIRGTIKSRSPVCIRLTTCYRWRRCQPVVVVDNSPQCHVTITRTCSTVDTHIYTSHPTTAHTSDSRHFSLAVNWPENIVNVCSSAHKKYCYLLTHSVNKQILYITADD